ncbi:TetR/AcrR family transcriptional regulator [Kribbella sindirgiensis]|uniref:TetR/AcrR family transcriptional regulator n=1 Tax=Kribbella sindirgiensis TaxID=1124744 RepID=A0A4R0J9E7_9ACTN|nr:TetR/AcrR family transcriptional regulator [Kribbella sindirgiensis]TCC43343.1 TetR/AcrR family transcriptional regulator [Kribbella sindirgiensis]
MIAEVHASRPGGRTARVRADVLAAVESELAEHGYDGLTIDAVAARSGVHRTTLYRRWKTVPGLLVDLLEAGADDAWEPADTGSLEGDLIAVNREIHAALTARPSITQAVIAASFRTAAAADALTRFWEDRYERTALVVSRAVARGEIPGGTDPHQLLLTATAPLYHQLVLLRQPMSRDQADQHARIAAASVR